MYGPGSWVPGEGLCVRAEKEPSVNWQFRGACEKPTWDFKFGVQYYIHFD